jgi:hypothetical protein
VGTILRLYKLGEMPPGLTNDEVTYVYNAYSVAKTGRDINNQFLPWITKIFVPFQPVPIYLIAPFVGLITLDMFWGRFAIALIGIFEIIILFYITLRLFRSYVLSLFSAFSLAVSPWHLQLTRSAYDPPVALLFYLLPLLLFDYSISKKIRTRILCYLLAFFSFALALFSYRAMNMLFIPLCIVSFWHIFENMRKSKTDFIFFIGFFIIVFGFYFVNVKLQGAYYFNEANSFESPLNFNKAEIVINDEIANADAPLQISRIFINKITYSLRLLRENYLGAFSTEFLFTRGEASSIYSIWWRGMLYLIDLPLIILGIIYLFRRNRKSFYYVLILLLVGPIPSSLSGPTGPSYVARAFFMLPVLCILIGGGFCFLYFHLYKQNKLLSYSLLIFLFITYVSFVSSYLYQYYARYSYYGSEAWFKSTKDLSEFLLAHKDNKIQVSQASIFELINYSFYGKQNPVAVQNALKNWEKKQSFYLNNIEFTPHCPQKGETDPNTFLKKGEIYITRPNCNKKFTPDELIRRYGKFSQGNEIIWKIYFAKNIEQLK